MIVCVTHATYCGLHLYIFTAIEASPTAPREDERRAVSVARCVLSLPANQPTNDDNAHQLTAAAVVSSSTALSIPVIITELEK